MRVCIPPCKVDAEFSVSITYHLTPWSWSHDSLGCTIIIGSLSDLCELQLIRDTESDCSGFAGISYSAKSVELSFRSQIQWSLVLVSSPQPDGWASRGTSASFTARFVEAASYRQSSLLSSDANRPRGSNFRPFNPPWSTILLLRA